MNVKVTKTFKGLTIEFIDLLDKPLSQELNTGSILLQLEDPYYKESNKTIRDLMPLYYTFLNNHYNLNPKQVAELDDWFNQPVDELLKYFGDELEDLIYNEKSGY
jgi:hypothetical protein